MLRFFLLLVNVQLIFQPQAHAAATATSSHRPHFQLATKLGQLPAIIKDKINRYRTHEDNFHLIEFSSPIHSHAMRPVVQRLEQSSPGSTRVLTCDVTSDQTFMETYMQLVKTLSGRYHLPLYFNRKSQRILYGPTDYANFEKWASGRTDYREIPTIYDYDTIRKTGIFYKAMGYIAQKMVERAYISKVPPFMDFFLVPLAQIIELNLTPSRELSSIRQLAESERVFNRDSPILPSIWNDIIATAISIMPDKHLGEKAPVKSIAYGLHQINSWVGSRLENLFLIR